ncbi:MAG: efflux RND transporter periplasmic adaptor subunit [Acidobacteriota bacterium]
MSPFDFSQLASPVARLRRSFPAVGLALLLLSAGLTGCSMSDTEATETDGEDKGPTLVPVAVAALEQGPIEATLRFSTNLEAERGVQVLAEASRKVQQLLVEEGQRVNRGQVLLRLEDDEQRSALAKVETELRQAQREYERQKRLHSQGFLSEEDFNSATYNIEQLELRLADAKRELSYATVRAPIRGTVTLRQVNLGDFVTPNMPLFEIVDFDSLVARVFVPERELARLTPGQEARLSAPALGERRHRGVIERIAPVVDPQTGTVKVTVDIPEREDLRPGLFVDVELVTDVRNEALLVPKRALVYDQDQIFVYRLREGTPEPLPAATIAGSRSEDDAEVVEIPADARRVERLRLRPQMEDDAFVEPSDASTLSLGDRIVVAGQAGLKDGALVRLVDGGSMAPQSGDVLSRGSESSSSTETPAAAR